MKRIIEKNGMLYIDVDGKTIPPLAYMSYLPEYADYDRFGRSGYDLFSACIYMGDGPVNYISGIKPFEEGIWKSRCVYDFSSVDRVLRKVLSGNCNAYIILRVNINAPKWWLEENVDDVTLLEDGTPLMQSVFSKKWKQDVECFLEKLQVYLDNSAYANNVIAWQIAAMHTEEWLAPCKGNYESDYSACARSAFQEWCEKKYGSIERLNDAWNRDFLKFSQIRIPTGEERQSRNEKALIDAVKHAYVIDYYRFFNETYGEMIMHFARYIKEIYHGKILVGSFYGYIGHYSCKFGHTAIDRVMMCEDIDFFASVLPYVESRKTPVDWFYFSGIQTCKNAKKLWFLEADIRTSNTKLLSQVSEKFASADNEYMRRSVWLGPTTEETSIWHMLRAFSKILISENAFWWFDMWGGWYRSPRIFDVVQKMHLEYVKAFQRGSCENAEVAIVLDSQTSYGVNGECFMATVQKQLVVFGNVGVPYHLYLKGCLKDGELDKYRLVVFLSPYEIDETDKRRMCALRENGTSVVVTGRNGRGSNVADCFDGAIDESTIRSYCYQANVHLYTKNDAVVYANSHYISVTAKQDGEQTIYCKRDGSLQDVLSSEIYTTIDKKLALTMKENQTILLKYVE